MASLFVVVTHEACLELGALAVELGLGDEAAVGDPRRVGEALAERGRDESWHSRTSVPAPGRQIELTLLGD